MLVAEAPESASPASTMGRMAQIVAVRLVRAFVRLGWTVDRRTGSHAVLTRAGRTPVTVPMHKGRTLKEGTARAILKQAGVTEHELFAVY
jgi:predicted RNA binding protein YcfA (HicA-like mRNA interferase family)